MIRALRFAIPLLAVAACAQLQMANPPAQSDWTQTLYYARRNVDAGNYFAADKILDDFVRTHPNTREAREIGFWKAAYMLDPANELGSLPGGIAALDLYLATDSTGLYRNEAAVLRRTAAIAQGIAGQTRPTLLASDSSGAGTVRDTVVVVSKSRDEEIASLKDQLAKSKDELAKLTAELDRIKKRLANPSN
jgi:uncharacterized protein YdbL (DUF1318 family)